MSSQRDSNTIKLTVHTTCYWVLDLLCINNLIQEFGDMNMDQNKNYKM